MSLLADDVQHFCRSNDKILQRIVLLIPGNQIRIIVALFQGNFVEDQVIHINENFSGRLRKHLHAVLGDSIQNKLNGAFPKMKFRSMKYLIIFRKNLLMASSKYSMCSDCEEIFSSDETKSAGNTLRISEHFCDG